jgi:predicted nucleic acid-binding protein
MRSTYLVDTNHLSAAINPVSLVRERIYQEHQQGARFRTCVPVICELEVGIQDSPQVDSYRRQLKHLPRKVKLVPLELAMTQAYGEVYRELRRIGRALSQVDMLLAAMVRHLKWTLLTADRDFEALPDIRKENWLV